MVVIQTSPPSIKRYVDTQDAKKVSKTGDTMTGNLALTDSALTVARSDGGAPIILKDTRYANGTDPSASLSQSIFYTDKNGLQVGAIEHLRTTTGGSLMQFNIKDMAGNWMGQPLVMVKTNTSEFVRVPTPTNKAENSSIVATTAWVNSANSIVHKTGSETVAGSKTFTSEPIVYGISARTALGWDYASEVTERKDIAQFKAYNKSGNFIISRLPSDTIVFMECRNKSSRWASIVLHNPDSGNPYAIAPPTPSDATGGEIATAGWCNSKFAPNAVFSTSANGIVPKSTGNNLFLRGDGTWAMPSPTGGIAELPNIASQLGYGWNVFAVLVNDYPDAFFGKTMIFKLEFSGSYKTSVSFVQCHTIDEFGGSNSLNPKYSFEPISGNYLSIYCKRESRADTAGQTHDVLAFNLLVGSNSAMLEDMTFSVYVKD